jgi:citrate lyase subunit beta/citryl-CoA lyase
MTAVEPPRSWLYVPGHDSRKIARARTAGADATILDLEDGVPASAKAAARVTVGDALAAGGFRETRLWVRVNAPLETEAWREDLAALRGDPPYGVVIPKVCRPEHVTDVRRTCADLFGSTVDVKLAPIVTEQAEGVAQMDRTLTADTAIYAGFWGSEDLSASLGASRVHDPEGELLDVFRVVRGMFLVAAARAGVPAVDTPYLRIDNHDALRDEAVRARWTGFSGKQVIHPAHVPIVNAAFTPTPSEVEEARTLVAAMEANDGGAIRVGLSMVDSPHLRAARRVLARSAALREVAG